MTEKWRFKPATDLDLAFKDRVRSIRREPSVFSSIARVFWWGFIKLVLRCFHRFTVYGREHLPKNMPYVLIGNHSSHLDVVSLMLSIPAGHRENMFPLAAADHFFGEIPMAAFTAFVLNALPMDRQGGGKGLETMRFLRQRLQEDQCGILLFPEGTRSRDGEMGSFRSGVGLLVADTKTPVVPCYIKGAFEAFPPDKKSPRPKPLKVFIGKPMSFKNVTNDKKGCEAIARQLEEATLQLKIKAEKF